MKKFFLLVGVSILLLLLCGGIYVLFVPPPPLFSGIHFSQLVYDDQHQLLRVTLAADGKYRIYTPLDAIAPIMVQTTLLKEDSDYYQHSGVDPTALLAAVWQTYIAQSQRRGASTITMQVARLRYHLYTRNAWGKFKQIVLAIQLSRHYSKADILTAYLNLAPYGNNIEGVGAASLIYYKTQASQLNLPQALTLSVIPQSPTKRGLNSLNYAALAAARENLFQRWLILHPADQSYRALIDLPLSNFTRRQLPFLAPHFVNEVLKAYPRQTPLLTSLDLNLQKTLELAIQQYLDLNARLGIHNAAAVLVDTRTMDIKALVGSANFFNPDIDGQVDGTLAYRSPGSALKPFIYGLAIDQGLIYPAMILKDTPQNFGNYDPENFDNQFFGPITAQNALILSRNIPAIELANQLHDPSFYQFLVASGMPLKAESRYGLALVLGGAEISMQHLAALYAMLANQGIYHSLNLLSAQPVEQGKRLLSPEASYLVLDMLQQNSQFRKINPAGVQNSVPIAWKTGTSSGYRDAWTAGVFGHYVLVVWIGDFRGKGNLAYTGVDTAAPLFFKMISLLQKQLPVMQSTTSGWKDLNLKQVSVCAASGKLPTPACPRTVNAWFIPGKSPIEKDTVYREILIDPRTGLRACHYSPNDKFVVYEFWPSDLLQIFQAAGIAKQSPPAYEAGCKFSAAASAAVPPHIISPRASVSYIMQGSAKGAPKIALIASGDADVSALYWFANDAYLGKATLKQTLWWTPTTAGEYKVRVVDSNGNVDVVSIKVDLLQAVPR